MLISIALILRAQTDATLHPHLGRANYAATLERLNQLDPTLGAQIHDGDGPKPITCSGLLNAESTGSGVLIRAGERYLWRVTGLTESVSQALAAAFLETPPAAWRLGDQTFTVEQSICDSATQPWSGQTTYEALAAQQMLQPHRLAPQVTLLFATPTAFKSAGMHVPIPLPNLLFGSLVERWNAFSSVTLDPAMREFGQELVAISYYKLQSAPVEQKGGGLTIGGIGKVTYRALGGDRYWLAVFQMLADFAFYSGVGVKTTSGMGQVRRAAG
jgi:CRISPR-associated endoribonuclease Cas6